MNARYFGGRRNVIHDAKQPRRINVMDKRRRVILFSLYALCSAAVVSLFMWVLGQRVLLVASFIDVSFHSLDAP